MDNFTKGLLERNQARSKALGIFDTKSSTASPEQNMNKENRKMNSPLKLVEACNSKSSIKKSFNKEPLSAEKINQNPMKFTSASNKTMKNDTDVAVEINITSNQNIQVEVEVAECEFDDHGKMIKSGDTLNNSLSNFEQTKESIKIRDHSRKNLRRLGALYSDAEEISSPIHRNEDNFCEKTETEKSMKSFKKFSKLASLANNINSWDDDYSHHATKTVQVLDPAKKQGTPSKLDETRIQSKSSAAKLSSNPSLQSETSASKPSSANLLWDKKVIDSLEAQGFTRRETSGPKLIYDCASENSAISSKSCAQLEKKDSREKIAAEVKKAETNSKLLTTSIKPPSKMKVQENTKFLSIFQKNQKDPAEMTLKERMAIFEKNKGHAPIPATPYGIADANPIRSNAAELNKKFNFGYDCKATTSSQSQESIKDSKKINSNIKSTVNKLLQEKETTISENLISEGIKKQREEDMKCIFNRFNKPQKTEIPNNDEIMLDEKNEAKRQSSEGKYLEEKSNDGIIPMSEDKKRMRISNQQRLYPVLSDIESNTDTEIDDYTTASVSESEKAYEKKDCNYSDDSTDDDDNEEDINMSFGREILNSVKKNDLSKSDYLNTTISSADVSEATGDVDMYLNEAFDVNESKDYDDKGSAYSDSFEYERYPKRVSFKECDEIPIKSRLEISQPDNKNDPMTLVHTVSFYRKQQSASAGNTPVRKIVHKPEEKFVSNEACTSYRSKSNEECDMKIQKLLDEVMRQQTIISQTSQALNLCASTVEFSGSTEAVEGERHLLVATHRRLACLNEVQRLKVEGMMDRVNCTSSSKEKGTLSIQEILIPLKPTYISRLANDEINGHHLLCLVKYNEFVLATKTLPTLPGLKSVRFTDLLSLNEVFADFKITLEIYGMTAQREILPHDIKYHIQTPNKKRFKSKLQESNLTRPPVQSPGGPNAVRKPALVQYGYIIFSIREIKQKSWVINETASSVSPLNGNVYLKIDSKITVDVDYCGFLTMFDDISGFGAWHRRWCRLSGNTLHYWKYPEDEKHKNSLGKLDLKNITSERVNIAPRAICARLHTILLESRRERKPSDIETMVLVPKGNYTTVRHLLAADTKEEREEWCLHLNKSLSLLKSWEH
ncbi:CLUMA_CG011505, isoform A [Clunio marinus]|uniref:CLUMA_CG011505, isoform A n=1 Tax=Clunio marinus TaxID=568069 RepID=A0A1J1II59_9DIPT|nr:CLUMA_CG011505, isoform A [Clunio marinus]